MILDISFQVQPEELCHVCSVYTGRETYPCRICYKVYHEGCLRKLGQCKDPASSALLKRAVKPVGWSCHKCVSKKRSIVCSYCLQNKCKLSLHRKKQACDADVNHPKDKSTHEINECTH